MKTKAEKKSRGNMEKTNASLLREQLKHRLQEIRHKLSIHPHWMNDSQLAQCFQETDQLLEKIYQSEMTDV